MCRRRKKIVKAFQVYKPVMILAPEKKSFSWLSFCWSWIKWLIGMYGAFLLAMTVPWWTWIMYLLKLEAGIDSKIDLLLNPADCFQFKSYYDKIQTDIIYEYRDFPLGLMASHQGTGTTTFLLQFSQRNKGVFYMPLSYKDLVQESDFSVSILERNLFPSIPDDHQFWYLGKIDKFLKWGVPLFENNIGIIKLAEIFRNEELSKNFVEKLGINPIFIFDNVELLKNFKKLENALKVFIDICIKTGFCRVILAGNDNWVIEHFREEYDYNDHLYFEINNLPGLNKPESIYYHKCKRPNEKDEIINLVYDYLKGNLNQCKKFVHKATSTTLEKSVAENIIKEIAKEERIDFERAGIWFDQLKWEIRADRDPIVKEKTIKTLQLMYFLIKNKKHIPYKYVRYYLTDESSNFIFIIYYDFEEKEKFIDFSSNLHRLFSAKEFGLSSSEIFKNARPSYELPNLLKERWNYTFQEEWPLYD